MGWPYFNLDPLLNMCRSIGVGLMVGLVIVGTIQICKWLDDA